jgi:hypothetical protein
VTTTKCTFASDEQKIQARYFEEHLKDRVGHRGRMFQLRPEHRLDGLLPAIREPASDIFEALKIRWHPFVGHARSSQACCVNFLMPMANRPEILKRWRGEVLGAAPRDVLPIEDVAATPYRYVAFEYTGPDGQDYLGEADGKIPPRGALATASDAAVAFIGPDYRRELLLIEWKYSEEYRHHRLSPDPKGKRHSRYGDRTFAPDGPIRADLNLQFSDFLREPFYQLLRQQLLAWQVERGTDFDRVRVLHLSPTGNRALHHVTSPAFRELGGVQQTDALAAFRSTLVDPETFLQWSTETVFACLAEWEDVDWFGALAERYPTLCLTKTV